jgi:hypothetical protein
MSRVRATACAVLFGRQALIPWWTFGIGGCWTGWAMDPAERRRLFSTLDVRLFGCAPFQRVAVLPKRTELECRIGHGSSAGVWHRYDEAVQHRSWRRSTGEGLRKALGPIASAR